MYIYKKSPPKDKKDVSNEVVSTENDIVSLVPKVFSEQQDRFSLFATSLSLPLPLDSSSSSFTASSTSLDATNQTIIFSAPSTPQDNSIIKMLNKFLKHIGFGEQDEAEDMLKKDNYLILEAGDLTDCAKREFKQITAFQYSLWALDFHMWKMLLKYLPKEEASKQVKGLKNGDWVQTHGHHADWQNLIDALQTYIDHCNLWSQEQLSNYWCQQVGGTQLLLPAHVINEYHNTLMSFNSDPEDTYENFLSRSGVNLWVDLATPDKFLELGKNFAWTRGNNETALLRLIPNIQYLGIGNPLKSEEIDKNYLKSLLSFRRNQVNMLIHIMSKDIIFLRLSFPF